MRERPLRFFTLCIASLQRQFALASRFGGIFELDMNPEATFWQLVVRPSKHVIFDSTVRLRKVQLVSVGENVVLKFRIVKVDHTQDDVTICTFKFKRETHLTNLLFLRGDVVQFIFPNGQVELTGEKVELSSSDQLASKVDAIDSRVWLLNLKTEQQLRFDEQVVLKNAAIRQEEGSLATNSTVWLKSANEKSKLCSFGPSASLNCCLDHKLPVGEEFVLAVDSDATVSLVGERDPMAYNFGRLRTDAPSERLLSCVRTTFIPIVEKGDAGPKCSKFGGLPFVNRENPWPACDYCSEKMPLFVQLNDSDLPVDMSDVFSGILQLFHCTDESCEPHVRVVSHLEEPDEVDPNTGCLAASRILGWETVMEYPHYIEGRHLPRMDRELLEKMNEPEQGEKLLGWPYWIQDPDYPSCSQCGERMVFFFQVDSNRNVPFTFGDCGIAHLFYCPAEKGQFVFTWACY